MQLIPPQHFNKYCWQLCTHAYTLMLQCCMVHCVACYATSCHGHHHHHHCHPVSSCIRDAPWEGWAGVPDRLRSGVAQFGDVVKYPLTQAVKDDLQVSWRSIHCSTCSIIVHVGPRTQGNTVHDWFKHSSACVVLQMPASPRAFAKRPERSTQAAAHLQSLSELQLN